MGSPCVSLHGTWSRRRGAPRQIEPKHSALGTENSAGGVPENPCMEELSTYRSLGEKTSLSPSDTSCVAHSGKTVTNGGGGAIRVGTEELLVQPTIKQIPCCTPPTVSLRNACPPPPVDRPPAAANCHKYTLRQRFDRGGTASRRNWCPESQNGPPGAGFDQHWCNRHSALQGVRTCHPWRPGGSWGVWLNGWGGKAQGA